MPELLADFAPPDEAPVAAAAFLKSRAADGAARIVTGNAGCQCLALWTLDGAKGTAPHLDQTVALAPTPQAARRLAVAGGGTFVIVASADTAGAALLVAHVDLATNHVDHVAPFAVAQPILSFISLDATPDPAASNTLDVDNDGDAGSTDFQLFCVQTKAIQQYALQLSAPYAGEPPTPTSLPLPPVLPPPAKLDPGLGAPRTAAATGAGLRSLAHLVDGAIARAAAADDCRHRERADAEAARLDGLARAAAEAVAHVAGLQSHAEPRSPDALVALRACMREEFIPAAEAVARAAATAVDAHFEERLARAEAAERARARRLGAQLDALASRVNALLGVLPISSDNAIASASVATTPAPGGVRARLRALAAAGDFDGAVYGAVECSDVDVLLAVLEAIGTDAVRGAHPLPFGQLTLLCLVQQLGTTLLRDNAVAFKLDWLQLAVLGLDASNPRIANHLPEVLRQVKMCLETLPATIMSKHHAQISILVHILTSLEHSHSQAEL
mmetsp:Transcript_19551/g.58133  ORF Transcript_19551/g.58133 Transcript_19551/m.58133 type:complete len:502 (-) Transcript_19551:440-1945(-)